MKDIVAVSELYEGGEYSIKGTHGQTEFWSIIREPGRGTQYVSHP